MSVKKKKISILEESTRLKGTVSFDDKMIINGSFEGSITGDTLIIGEYGVVIADIKAGNVVIGGRFSGELRTVKDTLVLHSGICEGKVVCRNIVVEPGGVLNAEVIRLSIKDSG
ncbi:polymer-forming cytoskeletal protein [Desulfobacterales bacterium HSG16]|nr:polymer-forming cytoskeletal protein [Desulfobacterales bacterium HSG16]